MAGRGEAMGLKSKLLEMSNGQCPGWGSGVRLGRRESRESHAT